MDRLGSSTTLCEWTLVYTGNPKKDGGHLSSVRLENDFIRYYNYHNSNVRNKRAECYFNGTTSPVKDRHVMEELLQTVAIVMDIDG